LESGCWTACTIQLDYRIHNGVGEVAEKERRTIKQNCRSIFAIVCSGFQGFEESCNVFRNFSFGRINSAFLQCFLHCLAGITLERFCRVPQHIAKARNQGYGRRSFGCYRRIYTCMGSTYFICPFLEL
jgi:hypothetical protein